MIGTLFAFARRNTLLLGALLIASAADAETVSTITLSEGISADGMAFGTDGNLFITSAWEGTTIAEVDVATGGVSTFATGLSGPIDCTFDEDGNLYATNWTGTYVNRILPSGTNEQWVPVGSRGDGLAFHPNGDLYWTSGTLRQIKKISPDGTVTLVASGGILQYPLGIAYADDGNFYVGGGQVGSIYRMTPAGDVSLFTQLPSPGTWNLGHIVYGNGRLYASGIEAHVLYEVLMDGTWRVLAGTGTAGTTDGDAAVARLNTPNGLELSADGRFLYTMGVAPNNTSLRVVELDVPADVSYPTGGAAIEEFDSRRGPVQIEGASPNPFRDETQVRFRLAQPSDCVVSIFDMLGREVRTLWSGSMAAGSHGVVWDGRANSGDAAGAGVYLARVEAGGRYETRAVTLVR